MTIEVVEFIQSFQNDFFTFFFSFISYLGEESIYIVILGIIYYAFDKRLGEFLAFSLFTAAGINTIIKGLVKAPRPFEKYETRIDNLREHTATGYSFPSGHTQNFTTFLFAGSFYLNRQYLFIVSGIFAILMALSRMYLGVHFLEDVLVSIFLGVSLSYVFYKIFIKYYYTKLNYIYLGVLGIFTPFLFIIITKSFYTSYGLLLGFVLAMMFEKKYINFSMEVSAMQKLVRVVLGLFTMILVKEGLSFAFDLFATEETLLMHILDLIRYALIAFVGLGLFPLTFKKFDY